MWSATRLAAAGLILFLPTVLGAAVVAARQQPREPGSLAGRLLDASTGEGIPNARVGLNSGNVAHQAVGTDRDGRFLFPSLPPGSWTLGAGARGFMSADTTVQLDPGQRRMFDVRPGQRVDGVVVTLVRPGYIAGRVTDERGEPVVTRVRAVPAGSVSWLYPYVAIPGSSRRIGFTGANAESSDTGTYELRVPPGDYHVFVSAVDPSTRQATNSSQWRTQDRYLGIQAIVDASGLVTPVGRLVPPPPDQAGRRRTYRTTATVVTVAPGATSNGIDLGLEPVLAYRIGGRVSPPPESPREEIVIDLVSDAIDPTSTTAGPDGRFEFEMAPAGSYVLRAVQWNRGPDSGGGGATKSRAGGSPFAVLSVAVVNADATDLEMTFQRGSRVSGRIEFEAGPVEGQQTWVRLDPVDPWPLELRGGSPRAGEFSLAAVMPGRYVVSASQPPDTEAGPYFLRSVRLGGRDVTGEAVDLGARDISNLVLIMATGRTELAGTVRDSGNREVANAAVVAFPTDRAKWASGHQGVGSLAHYAPSDGAGRFEFGPLVEGEYFVAVIPNEQVMTWPNRLAMEEAATGAQRVQLRHGGRYVVDIRMPSRRVR